LTKGKENVSFRFIAMLDKEMKLMTPRFCSAVLKANGLFLLLAGSWGLWADLAGAFAGIGPQRAILAGAPDAAIGFVEAHGLAIIFGVLLWTAEPKRMWHLTGMAIHTLLGTSNLVFWQIFVAADMLPAGYLTTSLHAAFVLLQAMCAFGVGRLEAKAA
jgi:hypothetical protein